MNFHLLNVILLNVILLNVILLNAILLNFLLLNVIPIVVILLGAMAKCTLFQPDINSSWEKTEGALRVGGNQPI
jgi:hypothetical protein